MRKFLLSLLIIAVYSSLYSQGVFKPGAYKCNVSSSYKTFYQPPFKFDTLTKLQAMEAQRVWRFIDFKEPDAKTLFTPTKSCEYLDLFEILKFGIITGKINAFSSDKFDQNALKYKIDVKTFLNMISFKDTITETSFDSDGNSSTAQKIIDRQLNSSDLVGYLFCEDWYFDSHWSKLDKRMFYISPIFKNEKTQTEYSMFYLYYNECRELLSSYKAINPRTPESLSYDALILSHHYSSFVVKKSNVFNRKINEYKRGTDIIQENDNTLKKLHNSESDSFER